MIRMLCLFIGILPGFALADDAEDLIDVLTEACVVPLQNEAVMAQGLDVASEAMATQLLNGKDATLWRHPNPKLVVVVHNSGNTCEIMGLGIDMAGAATAIRDWAGDAQYTFAPGENMDLPAGGGAYLVRAVEDGYVQIFVHVDTPRGFLGITAGRVADSAQAREVLGE